MTVNIIITILALMAYKSENNELKKDKIHRQEVIKTMDYFISVMNKRNSPEYLKNIQLLNQQERISINKRMEILYEDSLLPKIKSATNIIIDHDDTLLLTKYFQLLLVTRSIGDEFLTSTLGEIFIKNPQVVEISYNKLCGSNRCHIYEDIVLGFYYNAYNYKKEIKDYYKLKKKIEKLKPANYKGETIGTLLKD